MGDTGLAAALARARLIKTAAFEKEALNRAMKVFNKVGPEKWMKMLMKALRRTAHTQLPRLKARETALNKFTDKIDDMILKRQNTYAKAQTARNKWLNRLLRPKKMQKRVDTARDRVYDLSSTFHEYTGIKNKHKRLQDTMTALAQGEPLLKPQTTLYNSPYTLSPQELDILTRRTARYARYLPNNTNLELWKNLNLNNSQLNGRLIMRRPRPPVTIEIPEMLGNRRLLKPVPRRLFETDLAPRRGARMTKQELIDYSKGFFNPDKRMFRADPLKEHLLSLENIDYASKRLALTTPQAHQRFFAPNFRMSVPYGVGRHAQEASLLPENDFRRSLQGITSMLDTKNWTADARVGTRTAGLPGKPVWTAHLGMTGKNIAPASRAHDAYGNHPGQRDFGREAEAVMNLLPGIDPASVRARRQFLARGDLNQFKLTPRLAKYLNQVTEPSSKVMEIYNKIIAKRHAAGFIDNYKSMGVLQSLGAPPLPQLLTPANINFNI